VPLGNTSDPAPARVTEIRLMTALHYRASPTQVVKQYVAMTSGLDIHYDFGKGHPLLGRRMPDLDLATSEGPLRVFTLLHDARPILLNLGEPGGIDIAPWASRLKLIDARYEGAFGWTW
jgi:hypothetical protein